MPGSILEKVHRVSVGSVQRDIQAVCLAGVFRKRHAERVSVRYKVVGPGHSNKLLAAQLFKNLFCNLHFRNPRFVFVWFP